jgi:hypothetical protein
MARLRVNRKRGRTNSDVREEKKQLVSMRKWEKTLPMKF